MRDRGTGRPGRTRPEPSWPTVIATTLRLWLERHPLVIGRTAVRLRPLLALARAVERAGLERAGLEPARPEPAGLEEAEPEQAGRARAGKHGRTRFAVAALVAGVLVLGAGTAGLLQASRASAAPRHTVTAVAAPPGPVAPPRMFPRPPR